MLKKGVPSLFVDMKPLYQHKERAKILEEIMLAHYESLKKNHTLAGQGKSHFIYILLFNNYVTRGKNVANDIFMGTILYGTTL
jgi:hypothetical protein